MQTQPITSVPPTGPRPFSLTKAALFLPTALLLGALVGGAAAQVQTWFAPLVLFPLLIGFALGVLLVAVIRSVQAGQRPTVVLGTLLAIATLVVAEHYVSYRMYQRAAQAATDRKVELAREAFAADIGPTAGFVDFLRREARQGRPLFGDYIARGTLVWATWTLDALLMAIAALATVVPALRLPYCGQCSTWYRTTRSGRLKPPLAVALAEAAHIPLHEKPHRARYRLLGCLGGCEPTGLELIWRSKARERSSAEAWLTHDQRDAVTRILDQR